MHTNFLISELAIEDVKLITPFIWKITGDIF
ncbi:hypothetical protein C823_002859 [Eubacterium plexicaudatum ASF492]|nr:hypothetical protein C823_002859 [Eubacterium plexicaudatum ASF492]